MPPDWLSSTKIGAVRWYLIDDRRALWDLHVLCEISQFMAFNERALWDFSVYGFQRKSELCVCWLRLGYVFKFCWAFSRAENFVIFYQGLWAEKTNVFFFSHLFQGCFNLFWGSKKTYEIKLSNISYRICIYRLYPQILVNPQ